MGFPGGASGKEPAGPWRRYKRHGLGRSPGEEHGNTLQCSCLENPMDRGAWQATVYRVAQSQTWLKWHSTLVHTHSMLYYAKSLQSCLTLYDPIDGSPPGCPWDSPGKNTGVGCHFLLQCMKVKSESEVAQSRLIRSDPMDCSPPGSSIHGIF